MRVRSNSLSALRILRYKSSSPPVRFLKIRVAVAGPTPLAARTSPALFPYVCSRPAARHAVIHSFSSSGASLSPLLFLLIILGRGSLLSHVAAIRVERHLGQRTLSCNVSTLRTLSHCPQFIQSNRSFVDNSRLFTTSIIEVSSTAGRRSPCGTIRS